MRCVNLRAASCAFAILGLGVPANADYIASLQSAGQTEISKLPGEIFDLDVFLASNASDTHSSAIFRIEFSSPGFMYNFYTWMPPYTAGSIFDDSLPLISSLPATIGPALVQGPGFPDGVSDVELSNIAVGGTFGVGVLARLSLAIPVDYVGASQVTISVVPDTFTRGFDVVPASAGSSVVVTVPGPTALPTAAIGFLACVGRRRCRA